VFIVLDLMRPSVDLLKRIKHCFQTSIGLKIIKSVKSVPVFAVPDLMLPSQDVRNIEKGLSALRRGLPLNFIRSVRCSRL